MIFILERRGFHSILLSLPILYSYKKTFNMLFLDLVNSGGNYTGHEQHDIY